MSVSRRAFSEVYASEILGHRFVEDLDYYRQSEKRFWQAFRRIAALGLPEGARALDIGGGIMGVLMQRLLGFDVTVADVVETARADVEGLGLKFVAIDLFADAPPPATEFDLVVLQEVIEHIPQPPYVVLRRLAAMLKPGGRLLMTTPNGHRFRNLLYMIAGREVLDLYRYPDAAPGTTLGHQHEYTLKQLLWQAGEADFEVESAERINEGWRGATPAARLMRVLIRPADLVPHWRNSIVMMLRRSA